MNRNEKLNRIFLILLSLFVVMLGYGILLPVLPYYTERLALKDNFDTDTINFHIGLLTSVYPFFQLLFVVVWGKLSDKYGRKPIIIVGLIGFVIMQLFTGLATSLTMLYAARIFGGIFSSSVIPVSNAYLSDMTSQKQRTKIMAWSGMAVSAGVIFGPVIGGFLSQSDLHFAYSFGQLHFNRFSVPFFAVALFGLLVLFLVLKWLKPSKRTNTVIFKLPKLKISFSAQFVALLLLSFVLQFSITLFETVFSIFGKEELRFTVNQIAIGFMLCGSVMAVLQPVFASYGEKVLSTNQQIAIGLLVSGISLIALPFLKGEFTVYGLIVVYAIGGAMVTPNLLSGVSLISKEDTGRNLSLQSSMNSMGQILGPVIGTWLIAGGFYYPFITAGTTALAAIGLVYFLKQQYKEADRVLLADQHINK
ncbi:MFS transporter [Mariniflexile sp.]|uniref:MFS transporter n=1 Tax=Mariniflexile sp. TaxID=1979402 RepID=UPI0040471DA8